MSRQLIRLTATFWITVRPFVVAFTVIVARALPLALRSALRSRLSTFSVSVAAPALPSVLVARARRSRLPLTLTAPVATSLHAAPQAALTRTPFWRLRRWPEGPEAVSGAAGAAGAAMVTGLTAAPAVGAVAEGFGAGVLAPGVAEVEPPDDPPPGDDRGGGGGLVTATVWVVSPMRPVSSVTRRRTLLFPAVA